MLHFCTALVLSDVSMCNSSGPGTSFIINSPVSFIIDSLAVKLFKSRGTITVLCRKLQHPHYQILSTKFPQFPQLFGHCHVFSISLIVIAFPRILDIYGNKQPTNYKVLLRIQPHTRNSQWQCNMGTTIFKKYYIILHWIKGYTGTCALG